ncbi:hypothetical protein A3A38_04815 [Candidatus Kaiserbacteria bacterium RIFCSPLOWO2_01_FULL_53_17]|uniref:Polymerase beta nucleotidyltransferase domain-containing protein n=1 Tax=Candidatus Kaiserbacteria bacterium RIFCSPLOWO2_01_FULL_53_17 TaxID=1798511 RepID=A0A1F6EHU2_9BACT|nr:MAG: hypothetical protein A3A38_04815 [Candidatus Kaiserbacteria bacterium RIFCSPLOWO2_01_FULL_53_17]
MDIRLSEKSKQELTALGVGVLYLYGSRAQGTAYENSDYDVGVVFTDPKKAHLDIHSYNELYNVLSAIFPDMLHGPKLDIAILQRANAKLQMDAVQYGAVLFESDPRVRADYEESIIKRYDDYRFLEREYEDATFTAFSAPPEYV